MARAIGRLTALKVEKAKNRACMPTVAGSICASRQKAPAIGFSATCSIAVRDVGLVQRRYRPRRTRARALDARRKRHEGIDPIEARRAERARQRLDAAKAVTFKQCAESYINSHRAGWRNDKHAGQWSATLATYAYPVIGTLPVQAVDTGLVLKVLEPIWTAKPETASRLRGRIESVLDFAKVRGYRDGENPARWRDTSPSCCPRDLRCAKSSTMPPCPMLTYRRF